MRKFLVVLMLAGLPTVSAAAVELDTNRLCLEQAVPKEVLFAEILDLHGVPRRAQLWAKQRDRAFDDAQATAYVLDNGSDVCEAVQINCSDDEKDALEGAHFYLLGLFSEGSHPISARGAASAAELLSAASATVVCDDKAVAAARKAATDAKGSQTELSWQVRVRGSADDLYLDREKHKDVFKTLDKATLSFSQDDVADKRVRKVSGVVGVAIPIGDRPLIEHPGWNGTTHLIPYFGVSSDIAKTAGSSAKVSENTRQVGVVWEGYSYHDKGGYWWSLRPQALWNVDDDSRLVTAMASWRPLVSKKLNSDITEGGYLKYRFLFDVRFLHGNYTSLGRSDPTVNRDYDRLGAQVGFSIGNSSSDFPWEWTLKETWYYGFAGADKTIGQFQSVFSYTFGKLALAGIDLKYTDGKDGETAVRDKSWSVDLGFRY